jgi:soluble lytic murein transglycosylase-like protein
MIRVFCLLGLLMCRVAAADCLDDAAAQQGIDPGKFRGFAQQQSGMNAHLVVAEGGGTESIGLFQVSSRWLPLLKQRFGYGRQDLLDPCRNASVAAWLLTSRPAMPR